MVFFNNEKTIFSFVRTWVEITLYFSPNRIIIIIITTVDRRIFYFITSRALMETVGVVFVDIFQILKLLFIVPFTSIVEEIFSKIELLIYLLRKKIYFKPFIYQNQEQL